MTRKRGVGRTMTNSYEKDALVIGDDFSVYENYREGTKGTSEENDTPLQEDYDYFWDDVYETLGTLIKDRNEKHDRKWGSVSGWLVEGSGMGWRGQRGHKFIDVRTYDRKARAIGADFMNQILPQTDNTFYVYDLEKGNG